MIYVGQTKLTIELQTNTDLGAVSSVKIAYKKPNRATGYWTGTVSGTKIVYDVVEGDISIDGEWRLWAYVTFADNKIGVGNPVKMNVKKQGEI